MPKHHNHHHTATTTPVSNPPGIIRLPQKAPFLFPIMWGSFLQTILPLKLLCRRRFFSFRLLTTSTFVQPHFTSLLPNLHLYLLPNLDPNCQLPTGLATPQLHHHTIAPTATPSPSSYPPWFYLDFLYIHSRASCYFEILIHGHVEVTCRRNLIIHPTSLHPYIHASLHPYILTSLHPTSLRLTAAKIVAFAVTYRNEFPNHSRITTRGRGNLFFFVHHTCSIFTPLECKVCTAKCVLHSVH